MTKIIGNNSCSLATDPTQCQIILDFSVNDEVKNKFNDDMSDISTIKSKYNKIAKFK